MEECHGTASVHQLPPSLKHILRMAYEGSIKAISFGSLGTPGVGVHLILVKERFPELTRGNLVESISTNGLPPEFTVLDIGREPYKSHPPLFEVNYLGPWTEDTSAIFEHIISGVALNDRRTRATAENR